MVSGTIASDNADIDKHATDPARLKAEVLSDVGQSNPKELASIAVVHDGRLLMGKRRDNNRWTLPGGHMNPGEAGHEGARRELFEEAGVRARSLTPLGAHDVTTFTGKKMRIHAFKVDADSPTTHSHNDPDREVDKWEWIDISRGLPEDVKANLHSPRNIVLERLGLQ